MLEIWRNNENLPQSHVELELIFGSKLLLESVRSSLICFFRLFTGSPTRFAVDLECHFRLEVGFFGRMVSERWLRKLGSCRIGKWWIFSLIAKSRLNELRDFFQNPTLRSGD